MSQEVSYGPNYFARHGPGNGTRKRKYGDDIWIAAQTVELGAELITSDRHFENIQGLICTIF